MRTIETDELRLVPMSIAFMCALAEGRRDDAAHELRASLPPAWSLPREVLRNRIASLEHDATIASWLLHSVVRKRDRQLIGNVGFHGPPGAHPFEDTWPALVELGYTIAPEYRMRGYATAACAALIDWAATQPVRHVVLSIMRANIASMRVAEKLRFDFMHEYEHELRGVERLYLRSLARRL